MIGCHWEFSNKSKSLCYIRNVKDVQEALDKIIQNTKKFLQYKELDLASQGCNWREAFHPNKVQVWGRIAEDKLDSEAIRWFHENYTKNQTIKQSQLTGTLKQVGRIWHRMYPVVRLLKDPKNPKKPIVRKTSKFIELLTIFPDDSQKAKDFLSYLQTMKTFEKLWGD
jgi:CRISPR-associated protein Cmr6